MTMEWTAHTELGPYLLEKPLGAGGMGEVWRAVDQRLGRTVALKRIFGEHSSRFEQEARAIAALNHPHICQIYDVGANFLVLEYIEGTPLRGPVPPAEAIRLGIQIASALEEAHRHGILHRDLKPANILVNAQGSVKLLDFGLAKLTKSTGADNGETATRTGAVMGTAAYMSPEQAQGAALDERSDVFSFGLVLYELASGTRAIGGNSFAEILSAVLRDQPAPLSGPEPLTSVVQRCLRKDVNSRFQNIAEVRAALEQPSAKAVGPTSQSIAVLPFASIGSDPENEYFGDGLAEEIINLLAHVQGLRVIARTSAFAFKGQNADVRRIAETLGVAHILEGSVRKAGGRIRITTQLVSAVDGSQLWSDRYDRILEDIFDVQDEIGKAITTALRAKLITTPSGSVEVRRHEPQLPAYQAYLKGRHHAFSAISAENVEQAKRYYEKALELDPQFASAHVGIAALYLMRAMMTLVPAHEAMRIARSEARRALEIDSSLAEAHAMLAVVAALYDFDWKEAERRFALAVRTGRLTPVARSLYGFFYLLYLGRTPEALEELTMALQEDPLNLQLRYQRAIVLMWSGETEAAESELLEVLDLFAGFPFAMLALGIACLMRGDTAGAVAWAEKGYPTISWELLPAGIMAAFLERNGETDRAQGELAKLGEGRDYGAPAALMMYHLICGRPTDAAPWAEKAIDERYPGILFLLESPVAKEFREGPHWAAITKRLNLHHSSQSASSFSGARTV